MDELTALRLEVDAIKTAIRTEVFMRGGRSDSPLLRAAAETLIERGSRLEQLEEDDAAATRRAA